MRTIPCTPKKPLRTKAARSGAALIIVLAFVVLLTGLMVAFFSRSISDRQVANSSAIQVKTDIFAQGAISTITGDLKNEIAAGSSLGSNTPPIYLPTAVNERLASQPYAFSDTLKDSVLLKRSANGQTFFPGPSSALSSAYARNSLYPPSNRAAPVSTSKPSTNGRAMTADRWNKPRLFADTTAGSGFPTTLIPDWIMVARDGSNPTTTTANKDVVGRFAYTMYDESALLDVNAAGAPFPNGGGNAAFTAAQVSAKGNLALADLTQVGLTQAQVNTLLGWRYGASMNATGTVAGGYSFGASSASVYNFMTQADPVTQTPFLLSNLTGFLTVGTLPTGMTPPTKQTDKIFSSRQELIRFITQGMAANPADQAEQLKLKNLLTNLGTFSREVNATSWMPTTPAGAGAGYPYAANANTAGAINRNVAAVLVAKAFTSTDGLRQWQVKDPLMKYRFPLYRLNAFNTPKSEASKAIIKQYFCLQPATDQVNFPDQWQYVDPEIGLLPPGTLPTIKTLGVVSSLGREPTFWEVLQAAILSGSLGSNYVYTQHSDNGSNPVGYDTTSDQSTVRHLLKIGLDIIDMYDSDNDPTVISLGYAVPNTLSGSSGTSTTMSIIGEENLPGIYMLAHNIAEDKSDTSAPAVTINGSPVPADWYYGTVPLLFWNPHRNPEKAEKGGVSPKMALRADGQVTTRFVADATHGGDHTSVAVKLSTARLVFQRTVANNQYFTQMDGAKVKTTDGSTPDVLVNESSKDMVFPFSGSGALGAALNHGRYQFPKGDNPFNAIYHLYPQPLTYTLEKKDANGNWLPCYIIPRWSDQYGDTDKVTLRETSNLESSTFWTQIPLMHGDPRTFRYGILAGGAPTGAALEKGAPAWNVFQSDNTPVPPVTGGTATIVQQYYTPVPDMDGVTRPTDGVFPDTNGTKEGCPYIVSSIDTSTYANSRPTILSRPFTSVAEMGYAYRDQPWKSLNFFNKDSADSGLLDFFTLNSDAPMRAGVLNINHASQQTLAAVLRGAYQETLTTNPSTSYIDDVTGNIAKESAALALAIRTDLGSISNPTHTISNVSDLAALTERVNNAITPPPGVLLFPSPLKSRREVLARAFADVTNTRTWNVLIDVVAQTGRYGAAATQASQFSVEGEKRVWVHLAIDRYTGKVVDQQIESVNE